MNWTDAAALIQGLGVILVAGLAGGKLAAIRHLPRVTGYLAVGLLLGPSVAPLIGLSGLIPPAVLSDLSIVSDIALGLILLNIGGQCRAELLKRWKLRLVLFACGEIGLTFILVAVMALILNLTMLQLTAWPTALAYALLLGVIAIATAPGATLMVIREYEADGPVTHTALTLVGINNIVSILAFIGLSHWLLRPSATLPNLLWQMFGPLLLGGITGILVSFWAQYLEDANDQRLLLIGSVFAVNSGAHWLGISPLLAALMLGLVLANSSPRWHRLEEALRQIDNPLYVVFFVIAGANLHLETLGHIGLLGIGYVAARTSGKLLGARLGARLGGFSSLRGHYTGLTLLAQAGVAIGLAGVLAREWPAGGRMIESVVLGSVVVFELVGPLAVRYGLVRAGEVPILSLLQKRAPQGAMEGLHTVVRHFRSSLGIPASHRIEDPGDILVEHVMRRNVETILNSTPFNELLHFIAHSRYDRFPVVDDAGRFVGMINYTDIRNLLFEPSLANLVVASDLASEPRVVFTPDQSLRQALASLNQHHHLSYFPVVDAVEPDRLLGILSQNDLISAFRRQNNH